MSEQRSPEGLDDPETARHADHGPDQEPSVVPPPPPPASNGAHGAHGPVDDPSTANGRGLHAPTGSPTGRQGPLPGASPGGGPGPPATPPAPPRPPGTSASPRHSHVQGPPQSHRPGPPHGQPPPGGQPPPHGRPPTNGPGVPTRPVPPAADPTRPIPAVDESALPITERPTVRGPSPLASWHVDGANGSEETVLLPHPPLEQDAPAVPAPRTPSDDRDDKALVKASGGMAVATLVSRLTGFLRTLGLTAIVGLNLVSSSFNVANTLPNIIFELLIGGVLTSIVIPVLVRAAKEDGDDGDAFAQKLLSGSSVVLLVATVIAVVASPLLVRPYLAPNVDVHLAVEFAYLLLPQIFFYGLGAIFGAVLNARGVFGPAAWAPVLNNVVVLIALGVYAVLPSPPDGISTTQLLVLGVGSTLGIVLQAAVMLPAMRRTGFRWKWRFGWDKRLSEFGGLGAWVIGYVIVSQVGLAVLIRVASAADEGGPAVYSYAWLLIQVPYGVLGVSLLTALMPRMSAAAANGRHDQVIADLSLGSRLSTVTLLPVSAILTVFGSQLGVALFSVGRSGPEAAAQLGGAMAASAFGLLPMAVVMLQLRVFYAMNDARTPTLIMIVMTAVKVPMAYLCPVLLDPSHVVLGLAAVNAFGFVVGLVVGDVWLRRRLGPLGTRRVLRTVVLTGLASLVAVLVAVLAVTLLERALGGSASLVLRSWLVLVSGSVVSLAVLAVAMRVLRVPELDPVVSRLSRLIRRQ